jgi:hypothetical protein
MVNYMPIVPIGYLETLDVAGTTNVFILSQYWKIKAYRDFYLGRKWDTVVLDNALYEDVKATDFEHMMVMARQLDADQVFVVGPEKLTDGIETGRMTIDILEEYQSEGLLDDNINLMCILHERPNEMLEQWNMIRKYRDVALGISIFSYRLGFDRGSLHKFLDLPQDRYVHAFGWDNLLEIYNMAGRFNSIDSSLCVSAAINEVDLKQQWQITRNVKMDGRKVTSRLPISWDGSDNSGLDDKVMMYDIVKNIQFLDAFTQADGQMIFAESELPKRSMVD